MDWAIWVAIVALGVSIVSFIVNWWHSESVFHRSEYPAVAWHIPKIKKLGKYRVNTEITMSICNSGPKDISHIFISALIWRGFRERAWCKSEVIEKIPIGEPLIVTLTKEFEKDIQERFGGLVYNNGWKYKGKLCTYKMIINLKYQPAIADTNPVTRRIYCLIKPIIENGIVRSWILEWIPKWKGCLPRF